MHKQNDRGSSLLDGSEGAPYAACEPMSTTTGDDTRTALHALELAALQTATATTEAYQRIAAAPWFRADLAPPLRDGVPDAPIVAAIGDLASAAHAAARALHFAAEATPPHRPAAATALALTISEAATLAVTVAGGRADAAAVAARVRLAHAAALAAHTAAAALEAEQGVGTSSRRRHTAAAPFPASSRRLIRLLSTSIDAEAARRRVASGGPPPVASAVHLDAACAARDAAAHAMHAHDRCHVDGAPVRIMCRVARLASRASAHAGFAALRAPA
jgi:hypothetical protein